MGPDEEGGVPNGKSPAEVQSALGRQGDWNEEKKEVLGHFNLSPIKQDANNRMLDIGPLLSHGEDPLKLEATQIMDEGSLLSLQDESVKQITQSHSIHDVLGQQDSGHLDPR